ncbi:MarR family transcriptional regulator [Paenibacillus sp. IB182496]|uniref:MarR family transcriptional regulator n=1 Tax=Paenibacillus sabuli TaxID=2772509 RepID=A0A927GT38_9BACL|nr:MarR family transcriptional regulator [Paenibacillus sabuli]MBD2846931.1 MarR family transcriptional regulator [Paenibacillus sabuli]
MDKSTLINIIRRYEQAHFTIERRLNALFRDMMPEELTVDQFLTIRYIRHNARTTSSELADAFCVGKSSITAIITRLVDKGLIARVPAPEDRRVICLTLTSEGERLSETLEEKMQELIGDCIRHFDAEEGRQFIETYEKLAQVLLQSPAGEENGSS